MNSGEGVGGLGDRKEGESGLRNGGYSMVERVGKTMGMVWKIGV